MIFSQTQEIEIATVVVMWCDTWPDQNKTWHAQKATCEPHAELMVRPGVSNKPEKAIQPKRGESGRWSQLFFFVAESPKIMVSFSFWFSPGSMLNHKKKNTSFRVTASTYTLKWRSRKIKKYIFVLHCKEPDFKYGRFLWLLKNVT